MSRSRSTVLAAFVSFVATGCALDEDPSELESEPETSLAQAIVTTRCVPDYTMTNWNTGNVRSFSGLSTGTTFNGCMNFVRNHVAKRCQDYYTPQQWPVVEARSKPQPLFASAYYDENGDPYYLTFAGLCTNPVNIAICKPYPNGQVQWCITPGQYTPDGRW